MVSDLLVLLIGRTHWSCMQLTKNVYCLTPTVTAKNKKPCAQSVKKDSMAVQVMRAWCFSDRASRINYILITNLMHRLLFIYKLLFLYMFWAINAHLQEDTLYMQHMVLSLSTRVHGG